MSSVEGQKASRWTLPPWPVALALAAATLIWARDLATEELEALLELLLRPAQPKIPPGFRVVEAAAEPEVEFRLSHEGRSDDMRCILGGKARPPLCRHRRRSGDDPTERKKSRVGRGAQQSSLACRDAAQVDDGGGGGRR